MKLVVHEFVTLDGVVQGPGGPDEDRSGGFSRGGWMVRYADEDFGAIVGGWMERAGAILFGRTTYDLMRAYWPSVTDPADVAATTLNGAPKYVVSSSLTPADADWAPTTVLPDLASVASLRSGGGSGELQVHGCAALARSLHEAGLVDEYRLIVFPVTVGAGKRLFSSSAAASGFTVLEQRLTAAGAVYSALAPAPFEQAGFAVGPDGKETVVP